MELHLEVPSGGDKDVPWDSTFTNGPVSPSASLQICRRIIGHDHHNVIVTVRSSIPACRRTEQANPDGVMDFGEPPDNLS